jgi:hypothetical protein
MRHLPAKLYLAALCALANAQSLEPDTDGLFYPLAHNPDRLIALDRQTATIHTSAKWVGIGATAKSTSEFKPGKSPVRVSSGTTEFVVRYSLKIVPTQQLRPGEYALSSRAAFLNLFCFGVDE